MIFNGVIALCFALFQRIQQLCSLQADYVTVLEDRPIMSAKYRLPVIFGQIRPAQQSHGLFATAKRLLNMQLGACIISATSFPGS